MQQRYTYTRDCACIIKYTQACGEHDSARRFPYLRLAISDNKICLPSRAQVDDVRPERAPRLFSLSLSLSSGTDIDYEIAPDKANERPPRWARSVDLPRAFRAHVSMKHRWLVGYLFAVRVLWICTREGNSPRSPLHTRISSRVIYIVRVLPLPFTAEENCRSSQLWSLSARAVF